MNTGTGSQTPERSFNVLIVDDDDDLGKMLTQYLTLSGPYLAESVSSVRALWERLQAGRFDVMLLDFNLPDGDGLSVIQELQRRGITTPVVMVTGEGDERTAARAIQSGAVEYVVKDGSYEFIKSLPGVVRKAIHIHELQESAHEALEKIQYQAFLLNNVQDAIVVWDLHDKIIFWNFAAQRLFGWKVEEQIGRPAHEIYFPSFVPALDPAGMKKMLGQEIEHQIVTKDRRSVWVSSHITEVYEMNQEQISGTMNVSRDISERKKMEGQVRMAQAQLLQSVRLAAIGELASGIAHQINNPLTTIIADAQILLRQLPAGHTALESAKAIEQAGWRTQKIVQLLLEFSRPATGALETISINQSIEDALVLVGAHVQEAGVNITTEFSEPSGRVIANKRQIEDLWVHLLLLARDAVRGAGENQNGLFHGIRIRTRRLAGVLSGGGQPERSPAVVVEVHDSGSLIPAAELDRAFEPNLSQPTGGRGSGIELSICREIVRQCQGQIQAFSNPKEGTTIRVQFPNKG